MPLPRGIRWETVRKKVQCPQQAHLVRWKGDEHDGQARAELCPTHQCVTGRLGPDDLKSPELEQTKLVLQFAYRVYFLRASMYVIYLRQQCR